MIWNLSDSGTLSLIYNQFILFFSTNEIIRRVFVWKKPRLFHLDEVWTNFEKSDFDEQSTWILHLSFFTLKTTKLMFCLFILFCILKILLNLKKIVVNFKNRNHFVLSSNLLLFEYIYLYLWISKYQILFWYEMF